MQIEEFCQTKGNTIVGVYFANEGIDDSKLNSTVSKIADKIQESFSNSCILMVHIYNVYLVYSP